MAAMAVSSSMSTASNVDANNNTANDVETDEQTLIEHAEARGLRAAMESLLEQCGLTEERDQSSFQIFFEEQFVLLTSRFSEPVVRRAVLMTQEENTESDAFTGRLPIHLANDKNAPLHVIQWLLDQDVAKQSILVPDKWGDLPIHTACSRKHAYEVIKLLIEYDVHKTTIHTPDHYGYLPLHYACRYHAPNEVITLLLDSDQTTTTSTMTTTSTADSSSRANMHTTTNITTPTTTTTSLFAKEQYGQTPLHVACRCDAGPGLIRSLLDYDTTQQAVLMEDAVGRLPIHVYLLRGRNSDVIRMVLQAMLCHRLEQVGLDLWKHDMKRLLKSMEETPERDGTTRDKLDAIGASIRGYMERAIVLELGVWKASCLVGQPGTPSTHDPMAIISTEDAVANTTTTTAASRRNVGLATHLEECSPDYKSERRIKSGAEVMIPHILPFLEGELIDKLVQEIKDLT
jgi:hypothetical protein